MYSTYSRAYTTVKNGTSARPTIGRAYEQEYPPAANSLYSTVIVSCSRGPTAVGY